MVFTRLVCISAVFLISIFLQACGGDTSGSAGTVTGSSDSSTSVYVYGVAATGRAISGNVTLKDASGASRTAAISQPSGAFSIDVTGLTSPYFLRAADTTGAIALYSVATGAGNFNINPLTNLAVVAAAMSIDPFAKAPDAAFSNPAKFASLTSAQIQAANAVVMAQMSPAFQAALSANGVGNVNPLTDAFQVGSGLDTVFDNYVVALNTATGEIQETQVVNNTTTVLGLVDKLGIFPAMGIYDGTVDTTQSGGGIHQVHNMLLTRAGEMRFVMDNGVQVIANLSASGSAMTGTGKAYAPTLNGQPTNFKFADGSTVIDLAINGTVGTNTLSGALTYGSYSDTFTFTQNAQQTGTPSSLSKIAGTYASSTDSNTDFIGHIEANGKIWGSGTGIGYSGLIQVVDPTTNIYRVTLSSRNQDGTVSFVSGLATFYEVSPTIDALQKPATLVPDGYTGEVSSLIYSQVSSGNQGKLLMQLSSSLKQVLVNAVRMSTQLQTIAEQPTPSSLMIQAAGNPAFTVTATGDIQYSGSAPATMFSGSISSLGNVSVVTNPGDIVLNGADAIKARLPSSASIGSVPITISGSVCSKTSSGAGSVPPPAGTLIIAANPACMTYGVYGFQGYRGGNGVTYSGFLNGDTPAVLSGTLTYGGDSQGAMNAGTYTIIPGGLASSTYNIVYVGNTLTINPATLALGADIDIHLNETITADMVDEVIASNNGYRIYSGTSNSSQYISGDTVTATASVGGLVGYNSGSASSSYVSSGSYSNQ